MRSTTRFLVRGGAVAALYTVLTLLSAAMGLSSGPVQLRLSEALCVLPCFTAAAVPGLFVGCAAANLITGCTVWDVVIGSIATLLGAVGTRLLRKRRFLSLLPPILANTLLIPPVLSLSYGIPTALWLLMLSVGAGEVLSCGVLGQIFYSALLRRKPREE